MSFQCVGPRGPSGNPHTESPPAHGGGRGTTASNNHPGPDTEGTEKGWQTQQFPHPQHLPGKREAEYGAGPCWAVL